MAETSKPGTPAKSELPVQVFQEMERRDEDQILAEMRGELINEFVYSIQLQGKTVTNLSYAGVKEAIRRSGMFEILDVRTEETEHEIRVLVKVRDLVNRIDVLGASSAEKGKPFAYVLAVNKAERNAYSKLIPAKWYATLIQDWLQKHRSSKTEAAALPAEASQTSPTSEPKVPITKDPLKDPNVRQFPLVQGTQAVGMMNVLEDGSEASIVSEKLIPADDPALVGFFFAKVLDAMVKKHPDLEYHVLEGEGGVLKVVLLRGKLDDSQVKEVCNAARWAFSKAIERSQS